MKQRQDAYTGRGLPMIFQDDTDTYEDFESLALRWRGERFGSVGIVQKQYAQFDSTLNLRSGQTLDGFTLAYETYGKLNVISKPYPTIVLFPPAFTGYHQSELTNVGDVG